MESATFTIESKENQNFNFSLIDINGRLVRWDTFYGTTYEFHKNDLAAGMYFYKVEGKNGLLGSGKILVE